MDRITIDIPESYKDLYVVGDIHGGFKELVHNLVVRWEIRDSVIIVAGDCGFGFEKPGYYNNHLYGRIKDRLTRDNILLLCVRGNHDDPEYFGGSLSLDLDHLKTLPDYASVRMSGREIMCVGGAVSVDKEWRLECPKKVWWENESPKVLEDLEIEKLPGRLYGVISHEAPISFLPVLIEDSGVFKETLGVREYLEKILWRTRPTRWYYGHHHASYSGGNGVTQYRGLGIQELIRVPLEEDIDL